MRSMLRRAHPCWRTPGPCCLPLQAAAEQAAWAEGYHGPVTVSLEQVAFDERKLDGLTFPAGIYPALMVRLGPAQGHNWWGLVDRELALASAQVPDDAGTTLWEQGEIRWMLLLPQLLCRWFGGRTLREKESCA